MATTAEAPGGPEDRLVAAGVLIGSLGPIVTAGLLVPIREHIDSANAALISVVLVAPLPAGNQPLEAIVRPSEVVALALVGLHTYDRASGATAEGGASLMCRSATRHNTHAERRRLSTSGRYRTAVMIRAGVFLALVGSVQGLAHSV